MASLRCIAAHEVGMRPNCVCLVDTEIPFRCLKTAKNEQNPLFRLTHRHCRIKTRPCNGHMRIAKSHNSVWSSQFVCLMEIHTSGEEDEISRRSGRRRKESRPLLLMIKRRALVPERDAVVGSFYEAIGKAVLSAIVIAHHFQCCRALVRLAVSGAEGRRVTPAGLIFEISKNSAPSRREPAHQNLEFEFVRKDPTPFFFRFASRAVNQRFFPTDTQFAEERTIKEKTVWVALLLLPSLAFKECRSP